MVQRIRVEEKRRAGPRQLSTCGVQPGSVARCDSWMMVKWSRRVPCAVFGGVSSVLDLAWCSLLPRLRLFSLDTVPCSRSLTSNHHGILQPPLPIDLGLSTSMPLAEIRSDDGRVLVASASFCDEGLEFLAAVPHSRLQNQAENWQRQLYTSFPLDYQRRYQSAGCINSTSKDDISCLRCGIPGVEFPNFWIICPGDVLCFQSAPYSENFQRDHRLPGCPHAEPCISLGT